MTVSFPEPTTAGPGSAVHYRIEDSGEEKWAIIEDSPDPKQAREEIGPDHVLAREMSGKGVGGTFYYRRDPIQDRKATILAVINKYTYRKVEILTKWEDRFPGDKFVRKYTFPTKRPSINYFQECHLLFVFSVGPWFSSIVPSRVA
jgi:hypothetical protein